MVEVLGSDVHCLKDIFLIQGGWERFDDTLFPPKEGREVIFGFLHKTFLHKTSAIIYQNIILPHRIKLAHVSSVASSNKSTFQCVQNSFERQVIKGTIYCNCRSFYCIIVLFTSILQLNWKYIQKWIKIMNINVVLMKTIENVKRYLSFWSAVQRFLLTTSLFCPDTPNELASEGCCNPRVLTAKIPENVFSEWGENPEGKGEKEKQLLLVDGNSIEWNTKGWSNSVGQAASVNGMDRQCLGQDLLSE